MFTTFGGDIHIRGKQGQPTLNSLVNLVLQAVGENALPRSPQRLPLELGSVMHDGSFKYDLSTLLRTGEANFTRNAIVDGNQLLGPVLGLFQALYYLGKASTHIDEEAPAYLNIPSLAPAALSSVLPSLYTTPIPTSTTSVGVFVVCSGAGGSRGWYTGYVDYSRGILYGLELQTANFVLADPNMSSCYSLVQSTATYTSTGTEATDQAGYLQTVTNQYSATGSVAVTDWATLTDAISVVGLQRVFSYFSCAATDSGWGGGAGADCFFTLNNGVAVQSGTRNYFTSFFRGTNAPGWYAVMNGPVTDGTYAAVLGSFPNTLSVGGKITGFTLATSVPTSSPTPVATPSYLPTLTSQVNGCVRCGIFLYAASLSVMN